jgi:type I site-specific restriction-modification system R (restriction) subunit
MNNDGLYISVQEKLNYLTVQDWEKKNPIAKPWKNDDKNDQIIITQILQTMLYMPCNVTVSWEI